MKIGIASDHRGYEKKQEIIKIMSNKYEVIDYGNDILDDNDDYPTYAFKVSEAVINKEIDFGITLCGSGIGVSIAANKVKGIRCAKVDSLEDAILSRKDNDANVIALNADKSIEDLFSYIDSFVTSPFSNVERHKRRVDMISSYEE